MSFDTLGLRAELLRAVHEQDYVTPTPVQLQAIPAVLSGRDLMAAAQTGSGKTAGFTLPMLQRLTESTSESPGDPKKRAVRALILVPTRELAAQVAESVRTYGKHLPLRAVQIFGGVGIQPQITALRRGVDIVIATPGRLLDHLGQGTVRLNEVEILVLDEADRMLDMGFIHDIKKVLALLPKKRQNLLFSATFNDEITALAQRLLNKPELIQVTPKNKPVDSIEQNVVLVESSKKADVLIELFVNNGWTQALIFTRTKHGANRLAQKMVKAGINAAAIHGNKSQSARTKALDDFKANRVSALVATDIAARGLDIDGLPQVVNYELPHVPEDYVHRIGRTGRAGADGSAVSLVSREESAQLRAIERLIGRTLPTRGLSDPAPKALPPAAPRRARVAKPAANATTDVSTDETDGATGKPKVASRVRKPRSAPVHQDHPSLQAVDIEREDPQEEVLATVRNSSTTAPNGDSSVHLSTRAAMAPVSNQPSITAESDDMDENEQQPSEQNANSAEPPRRKRARRRRGRGRGRTETGTATANTPQASGLPSGLPVDDDDDDEDDDAQPRESRYQHEVSLADQLANDGYDDDANEAEANVAGEHDDEMDPSDVNGNRVDYVPRVQRGQGGGRRQGRGRPRDGGQPAGRDIGPMQTSRTQQSRPGGPSGSGGRGGRGQGQQRSGGAGPGQRSGSSAGPRDGDRDARQGAGRGEHRGGGGRQQRGADAPRDDGRPAVERKRYFNGRTEDPGAGYSNTGRPAWLEEKLYGSRRGSSDNRGQRPASNNHRDNTRRGPGGQGGRGDGRNDR